MPWAPAGHSIRHPRLTEYPLLDPPYALSDSVLRDGGISERAIFVVDKSGKIAFAKVYDIPTLPDSAEVRQAIEALGD